MTTTEIEIEEHAQCQRCGGHFTGPYMYEKFCPPCSSEMIAEASADINRANPETSQEEDKFEAMVTDRATLPDWRDLGDSYRFTVPMELEVTASSKAEALDRAMARRDAIGISGDPTEAFRRLGFDWHLHHPWGC